MVSRRKFLANAVMLPGAATVAVGMPSLWFKAASSEGVPEPGGAAATAMRLQEQINALAAGGGGTLRLAGADIAIDRPLVVPMGVSIIGPGKDRCLIRNVYRAPQGRYDNYRNSLFMPGNFHPAYTQNLLGHVESKPLAPFASGDTAVVLAQDIDAADFAVGDTVVVFDNRSYGTKDRVFRYLALRRITRIVDRTLHVDEPFRDGVPQGFAYNLRNGSIMGHGPGRSDSRLPLFVWGNGEIGGFAADTIGHMIADSAVYKGAFHDIDVQRSRTIWYGNCYQHTQWDGVGGRFMVGAGELSHNSEASVVRNFTATYDHSAAVINGALFYAGISMQENGLDITYRDGRIDVTGASRGNVVQIINFERARLLRLDLQSRSPWFLGNVLSISNAEVSGRRASKDGEFRLQWDGPCSRYVLIEASTTEGNLIDGDFRGRTLSGEAFRFNGTTARNVIAPTARFEQGRGRLLQGTKNQEVVGCYIGGGILVDGALLAGNRIGGIRSAN